MGIPCIKQATRLRELHEAILHDAQNLLNKAIEAGQILMEVKRSLSHGEFTSWVNENVGFGTRTVQRYMKIYLNREQLKNDSVSFLSDAHKMLTSPRLTPAERAQFELAEATIKRCKEGIEEIETALKRLRDSGYYRKTHSTFEEFCKDKWGAEMGQILAELVAE